MKKLDENCILLGYYAASSGNAYLTFRNNPMRSLQMGQIGCPETSVRNYHYPLRNNPEERSYIFGDGSPKSCMKRLHRTLTSVCRR